MKHKTATQTVGAPGVFKLLPEDRFFQRVADLQQSRRTRYRSIWISGELSSLYLFSSRNSGQRTRSQA